MKLCTNQSTHFADESVAAQQCPRDRAEPVVRQMLPAEQTALHRRRHLMKLHHADPLPSSHLLVMVVRPSVVRVSCEQRSGRWLSTGSCSLGGARRSSRYDSHMRPFWIAIDIWSNTFWCSVGKVMSGQRAQSGHDHVIVHMPIAPGGIANICFEHIDTFTDGGNITLELLEIE